jgi:pimeloyl-ACP methyl ester carboxylesterase
MDVHQESRWVPVGSSGDELHLRRVLADPERPGPAVIAIHGAVENGRVFWTRTGKGLASFLARRGFDVWVGDLRGRGLSRPPLGRGSLHGQTEAITEELPAMADAVAAERGSPAPLWITHSWGGVLVNSFLVRFPEHCRHTRGVVHFGTKRRVLVRSLARRYAVDGVWKIASTALAAIYGYLPARRYKIGSDNETRQSHRDSVAWVREGGAWVDPRDGFDYQTAAQGTELPPILYLAGAADRFLGHPSDVQLFIRESGEANAEYRLLSADNGNLHDYGHIDMLTHPDAPDDHFPSVADWLAARLEAATTR